MAHFDSAQGQAKMDKITQKHPYLRRSPQETWKAKRKMLFSMSTKRLAESVEGLNSSLAAGDLWPKKGAPTYWPQKRARQHIRKMAAQDEKKRNILF